MARLAREGRAPKSFMVGAKPPDPPPPELAYLLVWYWELRGANPRGWRYEPIPHSEIQAYRDLHDLDMTTFDVGMLRRLDGLWQEAQPEPEKPKGSRD